MPNRKHRKGTHYDRKTEIIKRQKRKNRRKKRKNKNSLDATFKSSGFRGNKVKLILRDGYACAYCSTKDKLLEVEHLIPRSRGGSNSITNLVLSCVDCNRKKSNQLPHEIKNIYFRKKLEYLINYAKHRKGH